MEQVQPRVVKGKGVGYIFPHKCIRPLTKADDGERLIYTFDKPRPHGSWQIMLTPLALRDRLARFIPPPRRHLHR